MVPQQQDSPSSSGIPMFGSLLVDKNSATPYSDATQVNAVVDSNAKLFCVRAPTVIAENVFASQSWTVYDRAIIFRLDFQGYARRRCSSVAVGVVVVVGVVVIVVDEEDDRDSFSTTTTLTSVCTFFAAFVRSFLELSWNSSGARCNEPRYPVMKLPRGGGGGGDGGGGGGGGG
uniref:Uncharacterized protein n=1 Tax=Vespula pensylvanica TaxID=30213 RepID=A0A834NDU4_VESPE|nr:hypothetical protein H0235_015128 [Vespula pensylvanica]